MHTVLGVAGAPILPLPLGLRGLVELWVSPCLTSLALPAILSAIKSAWSLLPREKRTDLPDSWSLLIMALELPYSSLPTWLLLPLPLPLASALSLECTSVSSHPSPAERWLVKPSLWLEFGRRLVKRGSRRGRTGRGVTWNISEKSTDPSKSTVEICPTSRPGK